jgi:hypothetical protein
MLINCTQVTMPMSGDDHIVTGWHLLAHCFLRLGGDRTPDAVKCFAHSATAGLDEDWQMVVETLCDIDSEVSAIIASQRSIGASGLTIETMPTAAKVSSSPKVSPRNLFPDKHSPR